MNCKTTVCGLFALYIEEVQVARPVINICKFCYACNTYSTIDIYALRAYYKNKEGTSLKRRNLIKKLESAGFIF